MKIAKKLYIACLLTTFVNHSSFQDSLVSVEGKLEQALEKLLSVYQGLNPAKPVQFTQSDIVGATYHKILYPYVFELSSYANVIMSAYSRKVPYLKDLQTLQKKFLDYDKEIRNLIKKFPKKNQDDAKDYFYGQLTSSVVQNCAKIVQGVSYDLRTKADDIQAAKIAYDLAWKLQTSTMKLDGFASVQDFQETITSWMINLYAAAISDASELLQKTDNKMQVYDTIIAYYKVMMQVYVNDNNQQKAAVEEQNFEKAEQEKKEYTEALSAMKQATEQATTGRAKIVIDFFKPTETKSALTKSALSLQKAQELYQQALQTFTAMQYNEGMSRCTAHISQLEADQHIRGIQLAWILFLENSYQKNAKSQVKAFTELQKFFGIDPTQSNVDVGDIATAFKEIVQLCSESPNDFSPAFAIIPLVQGAIQLYQSASTTHMTGSSKDRLANITTLNQFEDLLKDFTQLLQTMISLTNMSSYSVLSSQVSQAMVLAKDLDAAFAKNSDLKDLMVYFPDFEVSKTEQKSFQSFLVQYLYRMALTLHRLHDTKTSSIATLSYLMIAQSYKNYLTKDQANDLQSLIVTVMHDANLQDRMQEAYASAQKNNSWKSTAQKDAVYQSSANSAWQEAVQLYEMAIQLAMSSDAFQVHIGSTEQLQKKYITALKEYNQVFIKNAPKDFGYALQMVVPLYKLYLSAEAMSDSATVAYAIQTLQELFNDKTGLFGQVKSLQVTEQGAKETMSQQDVIDKQITSILQQAAVVIEQQELAINHMVTLFTLKKNPEQLLQRQKNEQTIILSMKLGQDNFSVTVQNPIAVAMDKLVSEAEGLVDAAKKSSRANDFESAFQSYSDLEKTYLRIVQLAVSDKITQEYKQKYFLAKTRYTASSLAGGVSFTGSATFQKMTGIPEQYFATKFEQAPIDMTLLGSAVPQSLQSFTTMETVKDEQARSTALDILKAYIMSQMFDQEGIKFLQVYNDYTLTKKSSVSKADAQKVIEIEAKIASYFEQFGKLQVSVMAKGTSVSMDIVAMPIPAITPLYPNGPYAGVYYSSAATLFEPGNKLLTIAGASYVPGQDQTAANKMYEDLGYVYLSQAIKYLQQAESVATTLAQELQKDVKAYKKIDTKTFMAKFNSCKELFDRAQSLLFATGAGAYYYFEKSGQKTIAERVKTIYLDSYKTQIDLFNEFTIGDPTANFYNTALSTVNQAYVAWTAELNPDTDSAQIDQNRQSIVTLYTTSGDSCMNYSYTGKTFTSMKQRHYMAAAANYESARKQYQAMQDTSQAAQMENEVMEAYFYACTQNVMLYYSAKKHGAVFTPAEILGQGTSGKDQKPQKISYKQLIKEYKAFQAGGNVTPGVTSIYNEVKDLLIGSSMFYQLVGANYQKQVKNTDTASSITSQAKQQAGQVSLNKDVLSYLHKKNVMSSQLSSVPYVQKNVLQKIFAVANEGFGNFKDNPAALANWCNVLNMAVAYQYIADYEGGVNPTGPQSEQSLEFQQKWQDFFGAVQKKATSLQNPSSAYVG